MRRIEINHLSGKHKKNNTKFAYVAKKQYLCSVKGKIIIGLCVLVLLANSCANRGVGPQGGPKDTIPPVPLKSDPEIGAVNYHGNRIEVTFDEYIQLDNIGKNLLLSPPQVNPPEVKARGKRLLIQFQDTLRDSTTYTIDFGEAVCDYREKVPLKGYNFYFATGPEIDTLECLGRVYDARTLNPQPDILVGIHKDRSDTAVVKHPFLRISKTDAQGYFRIGNIHQGAYKLYAIDDISRDYRLTLGEAFAFNDSLIAIPAPSDSAVPPCLFLFKEQQQKLYLQRTLREQRNMVKILFSSAPDSLPEIRPLHDSLAYITHFSARGDTVQIWLTDSASIKVDSLYLEARYRRTDSINRLEWCLDTLQAFWRAPKLTAKAQEEVERKNRNRRLEIKTNARKDFEIFDTLRLTTSTPVAYIELDSVHLFEIEDTVRKPIPLTIAGHDTLPMRLHLIAELHPGGQYELVLDSAALTDVYGVTHVAGHYPFKVKKIEDYSTLRVKLVPFEPKARIELLNAKDEPLREAASDPEGTLFEHLKPDGYYLRLYLDEDGDGKWTTGSWDAKRQPEAVYYFPEKIQTKSNWDFEQEWDIYAKPQTESKPSELVKKK